METETIWKLNIINHISGYNTGSASTMSKLWTRVNCQCCCIICLFLIFLIFLIILLSKLYNLCHGHIKTCLIYVFSVNFIFVHNSRHLYQLVNIFVHNTGSTSKMSKLWTRVNCKCCYILDLLLISMIFKFKLMSNL